jgi:hypothetical protein
MSCLDRDLEAGHYNLNQLYDRLQLIRYVLYILSLFTAATIWMKFDVSFYHAIITLVIALNVGCMCFYLFAYYKPMSYLMFLEYSKKILYHFSKLYRIVFLVAGGYFIKIIYNFYVMNFNISDYLIGIISIISFVLLYRHKQDYENKIYFAISEDNDGAEFYGNEMTLTEENGVQDLEIDDNITDCNLSLANIENLHCTDSEKAESIILEEQQNIESVLEENNTDEKTELLLQETDERNVAESNEKANLDLETTKFKKSKNKSRNSKSIKFAFYDLFNNIVSVDEAKNMPFKEFWKKFLNTFKNQIITIGDVTFIFEENKFYKKPKKKKKHYYSKNSMKTNYSLYRNNKLI